MKVIILLCEEVSEEFQASLTESISNITNLQFTLRWDTWKGLYAAPPEEDCWSSEDINELVKLFESHPQVYGTDVSPYSGSVG